MSTSTGSDDELIRQGPAEGEAKQRTTQGSLDEDMATRVTRGVVDGFTEASQAFSNELEGTNRFPDLMGRSLAGVIRANARLLDEVATVVRQASESWGERPRPPAADDIDYDRLADLIAARLNSTGAGPTTSESSDTARTRRKT
jgi:hypothetical protein